MKFSELTLDRRLQQAVEKIGYEACTPIQEQAISHILAGRDLAGLAQTGTGKTAAFLLPLIERILRSTPSDQAVSPEEKEKTIDRVFKDWQPRNFILVLVPTRELADQVFENLNRLVEFAGLQGVCIYGGTGYDKQREGLRKSPQFVIATPGRMIDLYKTHEIDLKQVRAVVFDEADRMFDMGFKDDMVYILHRVPRERQVLMFSATLNFDVLNTAYQYGADPVEINVSRDQAKAENVKDTIYHVGSDEKPQYLLSLLKLVNPQQSIIFTNFKVNVERIARFLNDNGIQAMAISSLLSQAQRNRVIQQFKATNNMNILVATDVAARGLDIQGVDLVINYEMPNDPESYVHRIGRTGRAGASGNAISFVSDKDVDSLMRVEEYLKHKIDTSFLEDKDFVKDFKPLPRDDYSFRSRDGGGGRDSRGAPGRGRDRFQKDRNTKGRSPQGGDRERNRDGERDRRPHGARDGQKPRSPHGRPPRPTGPGHEHGSAASGPSTQSPRKHQSARPDHRRVDRNKSARPGKPHAAKTPPGLGQKVKGFFKRLLGS